MGKEKEPYVLLSEKEMQTFLLHGNVLISLDRFYRRLIALYNLTNNCRITRRVLTVHYDRWYDTLADLYKKDFADKLHKVVNFRFLKAERSYEVDCIIIEGIGDIR